MSETSPDIVSALSTGIIGQWHHKVCLTFCKVIGKGLKKLCIVIVLHDYLATLPEEVNMFWGGKYTGANVLFFLNRYTVVIFTIVDVLADMDIPTGLSTQGCNAFLKFYYTFQFVQYVPWAAFSGMHAFALTRNLLVSLFIFLLDTVPLALNIVDRVKFTIYPGNDASGLFGISSRASLILADILLIEITWGTLSRSQVLNKEESFVYILLRDGTIYFTCLLILNLLRLIFAVIPASALYAKSSMLNIDVSLRIDIQ
ncbi:hypothetical protein C8Q74DRAFT_1366027 [Fomes fomentarius]|nr:hypothetical protein C8Q74DRAFT_1366027 [Fomes fomentarius]